MTTVVAAVPSGFMPGVSEGLLEPAAELQAEQNGDTCAALSRTIFGCAYASDDVDPGSYLFVVGVTEGKQQVHRSGSKEK